MNNMTDEDYEDIALGIYDAVTDEGVDYEIAIAVFPKESTMIPGEQFPAVVKTSASPGLTGQVFISYLKTNPPEGEKAEIWTKEQGIRH